MFPSLSPELHASVDHELKLMNTMTRSCGCVRRSQIAFAATGGRPAIPGNGEAQIA